MRAWCDGDRQPGLLHAWIYLQAVYYDYDYDYDYEYEDAYHLRVGEGYGQVMLDDAVHHTPAWGWG